LGISTEIFSKGVVFFGRQDMSVQLPRQPDITPQMATKTPRFYTTFFTTPSKNARKTTKTGFMGVSDFFLQNSKKFDHLHA
jgi:hypothetical protein